MDLAIHLHGYVHHVFVDREASFVEDWFHASVRLVITKQCRPADFMPTTTPRSL